MIMIMRPTVMWAGIKDQDPNSLLELLDGAAKRPPCVTKEDQPMPVDTTDLDPEIKAQIDNMSREELENHLREENTSSDLRQGLAGEYFEERFKGATGMTSDDFYREERLKREEEEEREPYDDEALEAADDEDEEPGTAHFEDK
jgi:hypothetical protein